MSKRTHHAISLFSNCGAGDVGYKKAGFTFDVMAELDKGRMSVCLLNHPNAHGVRGDLRITWRDVVKAYKQRTNGAELSLLAACPPCQGMSSARSGRGLGSDPDAGVKDARNLLVTVISNVARELKPRIIIVENVQAFLTRKIKHPKTGAPISAAKLLMQDLKKNYVVFPVLVDLGEFGVPQTRKRTFLTFIRRDNPTLKTIIAENLFPYPTPSHALDYGGTPINLKEALSSFGLDSLDASSPEKARSKKGIALHSVPVWSKHYYAMVASIPRHKGGSGWQNNRCVQCGVVDVKEDDAVCPKCSGPLLRPVVKEKNSYRLVHGFKSSTYSRMKSYAPAATITTATGHIGSNHTIHPFENRVFSALECALLQTFPRNFKWGEAALERGHTRIRDMIGEAVPPLFTEKHGKVLIALLECRIPRNLITGDDLRCKRAVSRLDSNSGKN